MSIVSKLAAVAAVIPVLAFSAPVFAESNGQLQGGPVFYQAKNVTQSGAYAQSTTVKACNDILQFSIDLHNTNTNPLNDINVKATLGGASSTATATPSVANAGATGTVSINGLTSNESLSYVNGSTKAYSGSNYGTVTNVADGITSAAGVNVGGLLGSETKFVNFQAKVNCQTPPKKITVCELATKKIVTIEEGDFDSSKYSKDLNDCKVTPPPHKLQVCDLSTKKVVTIDENEFDSAKYSKDLNKCTVTPVTPPVTPPTVLPNTGAGNVIGLFTAVTAAGAVAYRIFARRLSRQ